MNFEQLRPFLQHSAASKNPVLRKLAMDMMDGLSQGGVIRQPQAQPMPPAIDPNNIEGAMLGLAFPELEAAKAKDRDPNKISPVEDTKTWYSRLKEHYANVPQ